MTATDDTEASRAAGPARSLPPVNRGARAWGARPRGRRPGSWLAASDGDADSRWFGSSKSACKYAGSLGVSDERCRATVHSLSKVPPRIRRTSERTTRRNPLVERASDEAADGTRTHDLLHGKQLLNRGFPLSMRDPARSDTRGLPAITVDLGNEWVTDSRRSVRRPATGCGPAVAGSSPVAHPL